MKIDEKGMLLITTLWVLGILCALFAGISYRLSLEARLNKHQIDSLKARYCALAGVTWSMEILSKDNNVYDSAYQCGVTLGRDQKPGSLFDRVAVDDGFFSIGYGDDASFRLGLSDEERKFNINAAPRSVLMRVPGMTPDLASHILDWRDADHEAQGSGAENAYYRSLPQPYFCRNKPFGSIEETRLVRGVQEAFVDTLEDYFTVYGDGKLNINTASKEALKLTGMSEALIAKLLDYRKGRDAKESTEDDRFFRNLEDVFAELSLPEQQELAGLRNFFKVRSSYFRIESRGTVPSSGAEKRTVCVVQRENRSVKLISYREF